MAMEDNGLDAMFIFTVSMGVITLLMAWVITVIAIKGWAVRKENRTHACHGVAWDEQKTGIWWLDGNTFAAYDTAHLDDTILFFLIFVQKLIIIITFDGWISDVTIKLHRAEASLHSFPELATSPQWNCNVWNLYPKGWLKPLFPRSLPSSEP